MGLDYWVAVQVWQLAVLGLGGVSIGALMAYLILTGAWYRGE